MEMKTILTIVLLSYSTVTHALNITQVNASRTQEIIKAATEAHAIDQLKSIYFERDAEEIRTYQSRIPGPPWDKELAFDRYAIDFERQSLHIESSLQFGGLYFHSGVTFDGKIGERINYRNKTRRKIQKPDFNTLASRLARATPVVLVKQLRDRAHTATWLGQTQHRERKHELVRFVMEDGVAITLYFDAETYMLSKSDRIGPWGLIEFFFDDYKTINSIPINHSLITTLDGEYRNSGDIKNIRLNEPIQKWFEMKLQYTQQENYSAPPEMSTNEVAKGVYHTGTGGAYSLFVDMGDHLIAIGTTAGAGERIAHIQKIVGEKPIRYAVVTHHHSDHIAGASEFLDVGATLIAARQHEDPIRKVIGNRELPIYYLKDRHDYQGIQPLQVIDIGPTPHAEHDLVGWLPNAGILFEADHFFASKSGGPMPPAPPATVALYQAIERMQLQVKTIIGPHNNRTLTIEDLQRSVAKTRSRSR